MGEKRTTKLFPLLGSELMMSTRRKNKLELAQEVSSVLLDFYRVGFSQHFFFISSIKLSHKTHCIFEWSTMSILALEGLSVFLLAVMMLPASENNLSQGILVDITLLIIEPQQYCCSLVHTYSLS